MTRIEFFKAAAGHDWYYEMSDDHRYYVAGREHMRQLQADAQGDEVKKKILDAWTAHMFSGTPWNTERTPRPQLSDFGLEEA